MRIALPWTATFSAVLVTVAAAQALQGAIQPADAVKWAIETPGKPVQIATLWGSRATGPAGVLIKVPGGWDSGLHLHTADYHALVVAGRWVHTVADSARGHQPALGPGSYFSQRRGVSHSDSCVDSADCIVFVYTAEPVATVTADMTSPSNADTKPSTIVPFEALPWVQQSPDVPLRISLLWGNRERGPFGELVRMPSGFDSGLHAHTGAYHGVLVAGTWVHVEAGGAGEMVELRPGSYVMQPGGGMHIDRCKAGPECVLFIFQDTKADVLWPPR